MATDFDSVMDLTPPSESPQQEQIQTRSFDFDSVMDLAPPSVQPNEAQSDLTNFDSVMDLSPDQFAPQPIPESDAVKKLMEMSAPPKQTMVRAPSSPQPTSLTPVGEGAPPPSEAEPSRLKQIAESPLARGIVEGYVEGGKAALDRIASPLISMGRGIVQKGAEQLGEGEKEIRDTINLITGGGAGRVEALKSLGRRRLDFLVNPASLLGIGPKVSSLWTEDDYKDAVFPIMAEQLKQPTEFEQKSQERTQQNIADAIQAGGAPLGTALGIANGATETAISLLAMKQLTGAFPGGATTSGQGATYMQRWLNSAKSTVQHAGKVAAFKYLTTPGDEPERMKSAALAFAYVATPAISTGMPSEVGAKVVDFLLNTGITLTTGQYKDAYAEASRLAQEHGGSPAKYLPMTMTPLLLSDALFSASTKSANNPNAVRAAEIQQRSAELQQEIRDYFPEAKTGYLPRTVEDAIRLAEIAKSVPQEKLPLPSQTEISPDLVRESAGIPVDERPTTATIVPPATLGEKLRGAMTPPPEPTRISMVEPDAKTPIPTTEATGLRESVVVPEREALGLPPEGERPTRSFEQFTEEAHTRRAADPASTQRMIDELKTGQRQLRDTDVADLTIEKTARMNARNAALDALDKARESGDLEAIKQAEQTVKSTSDALEEVFNVAARGEGTAVTETARALNALRLMMNERYELVNMEETIRAKNGGKPVTAEQRGKIWKLKTEYDAAVKNAEAQSDKVRTEQAEMDDLIADTVAKAQFDAIVKEQFAAPKKERSKSKKLLSIADSLEASALASMKARSSKFSVGIDPTVLVDVGKLGTAYILRGTVKFAEWADKMTQAFKGMDLAPYLRNEYNKARMMAGMLRQGKTDAEQLDRSLIKSLYEEERAAGTSTFEEATKNVVAAIKTQQPGITDREVRDLFTEYGKIRKAKGDPVLSNWRSQGQKLSAMEDIAKKLAPKKTGDQRHKPDAITRQMEKQLRADMKAMGIETKDPLTELTTPATAIQNRLKNSIEEIQRAIDTETRLVRDKGVTVDTPAIKALRKERDALRAEYDKIFPKEPPTWEQSHDRAIKNAERTLESINAQIAKGAEGLREAGPSGSQPWSKKLSDLKRSQTEARAKLNALKESIKPQKTPEQLAQEQYEQRHSLLVKTAERSIDALQKRINMGASGILNKTISGQTPWSIQLANLKLQQKALRNQLKELRESLNPKLSPEERAIRSKKARMNKAIEEYKRRMAEGDFKPKARKEVDITSDPEAMLAKQELDLVKMDFEVMKAKAEWAAMSAGEKAVIMGKSGASAIKSLLSSFDLSGMGRQGALLMLSDINTWRKSFLPMLRALNRAQSIKENAKIFNRENYKNGIYDKMGLVFEKTDATGDFSSVDDLRRIDLAAKIPILGTGVAASNRAYGTALNKMRADLADKLYKNLSPEAQKNPQVLDNLGKFVDSWTGRGRLGTGLTKATAWMWAQKFWKSAVDVSITEPLKSLGYTVNAAGEFVKEGKLSPETKQAGEVRKIVTKEYSKAIGMLSAIFGSAAMAGFDIDLSPTSGGFGNITFPNGFYWNPIGFIKPWLVFLARTVSGQQRKGERVANLRPYALPFATERERRQGTTYGEDYRNTIWRFIQSKAHPAAGTAMAVTSGKDYLGEDLTAGRLASQFLPLAPRESAEAIMDMEADAAIAITIGNMLGLNVGLDFEQKRKIDKMKKRENRR